MSFTSFFAEYKWILLFYTIIILIIYFNRKKFDIQAKIIAMYRTKFGIASIDNFSRKYGEAIKIVGYIGIGIGMIGIVVISGFMIKGLFDLFLSPDAPPAITPVIPGVKIPGSPIFVPFWYGIISLFIVVVVHEFSHGIVARAHGLKIKNTGIVFFGPLIGAFVEPDEKELKKKSDVVQYSIFAAGPFSNIILALIAFCLVIFVLSPVNGTIVDEKGISFYDVQNNTPAYNSGIYANATIIKADSYTIKNMKDFENFLITIKPDDTITLITDKQETFVLNATTHPKNPSKGYLGIIGVHAVTKLKNENIFFKSLETFLKVLAQLFMWIFMLSLGIGLANLLPLGPVDGGRMVEVSAKKIAGKEKGFIIWKKITVVTVIILLILLFFPIIRSIIKM